jgi:hypothetical protein
MKNIFAKAIMTASAFAALACTIVPAAASAGELSNRIANEQYRINGGVRDGQETFREYDRTEWNLARINAQRSFWLRTQHGRLTRAEFAFLNRELNGNSHAIFFDNHNFARQPGTPLR